MATQSRWTVKQVNERTGVSIRTLHYYDEIGLLAPRRSGAGYRLYTDTDLLRLQQILIGRSLGFALEAIRRSLDDPKFDAAAALRRDVDLQQPLCSIATAEIECVTATTPIARAVEIMRRHDVKHVLVTDDAALVVGILSIKDVLRMVLAAAEHRPVAR